MPCLITLSQEELHRLEAIQKVRDRRLSVVQAAELLNLSRSQVHRLLQIYDQDGASGLASKRRGRPSNRRHTEDFRNAALDLVRDHYVDFGPTLAAERLLERHQLSISKETLRQFMTFEELLRRNEDEPPHPRFGEFHRPPDTRQPYFDALEVLRGHLSRCPGQIAAIAGMPVPGEGLIANYQGSWQLDAYKEPPALPSQ